MGAWSARPALPGLEERGKGRGGGSEGAEPRRRSGAQHPKTENQTGSGGRGDAGDPQSDRSGAGKMTAREKEAAAVSACGTARGPAGRARPSDGGGNEFRAAPGADRGCDGDSGL